MPAGVNHRAGHGAAEPGQEPLIMSVSDPASNASSPALIANQPYLLLCVTALCWAGNAIVGRSRRAYSAGNAVVPALVDRLSHHPSVRVATSQRDWSAIRAGRHMIVLSIVGIGGFNTVQYWALEYTTALNTLRWQSAGPLFVAVWSLILLGVRLTPAQAGGVALSLTGVLVILLHGDLAALAGIEFNKGDIIFTVAVRSSGCIRCCR